MIGASPKCCESYRSTRESDGNQTPLEEGLDESVQQLPLVVGEIVGDFLIWYW